MTGPREPGGIRLFPGLLLAASAAAILLFLAAGARRLVTPVQWDYAEGLLLWGAKQAGDLARVYRPIGDPPWMIFPYTPLYLLAARAFHRAIPDLLTAGRAVSLLSTLAVAGTLFVVLLRNGSRRLPPAWRWAAAALGVALLGATESVGQWASLMRVDMLAVALTTGGLAAHLLGRSPAWRTAGALLFVLALFTKQSVLAAPLACLAIGLATEPRSTARSWAPAAALGLAGLWGLQAATGGGFFENAVRANLVTFSWRTALWQLSLHLRETAIPSALAAALLAASWNARAAGRLGPRAYLAARSRSRSGRAVLFVGLTWLLEGLWLLGIGKKGSSLNFFLTWDVTTALLSGLLVLRLLAGWRSRGRTRVVEAGVAAALLVAVVPCRTVVLGCVQRFGPMAAEEARVVRLVREAPGPVLSENLAALDRAGKELWVEPAAAAFLAEAGRWDEAPYVRMIEARDFGRIVTTDFGGSERYSPAVRGAIARNYVLEEAFGPYLVFRPRAPGDPPSR